MYIGYPLGGLLIALALFLMLKSCGCILSKENYPKDKTHFSAINEEDEEYGSRMHGKRLINESMAGSSDN